MTGCKCFLNERGDQEMLELILLVVLMVIVLMIQFEMYSIPPVPSKKISTDTLLPEECSTIIDVPLDLQLQQ